MDSSLIFDDLLFMLSALGSAVAGLFCGWQIRSANVVRAAGNAEEARADESGVQNSTSSISLLERSAKVAEDAGSLPAIEVKEQLFSDEETLSEHSDRVAQHYANPANGLSQLEISEIAQRLILMADQITADVDAHDAQLTAVNSSIRSEQSHPTMESVMAAVERLVSANETMQAQLRESRDRIVEQAREIETAEIRANTDALTQVGNRRAFDCELANWSGKTPGALAILDIDFFKKFNDDHGHRAGDEVLKSVANVLRSRLSDHCLVARYGGEEFGLVFNNHKLEDVLDLIESVRRAIPEHKTTFEGKVFHVTCSLGVTRLLAGEPSSEWLQRADDGLYLSKDTGRNRAHCIDSIVIGKRETPFLLDIQKLPSHVDPSAIALAELKATPKSATVTELEVKSQRRVLNQGTSARIPNRDALAESYRSLLLRLGKAPVKLSVMALSVSCPESEIELSGDTGPVTRFSQLLEIAQAYCRAVDRVGVQDEHTLLVCMPGIDGDAVLDRAAALTDVASVQLQIDASALSIGIASVNVDDTFETLVTRAVEQLRSSQQ